MSVCESVHRSTSSNIFCFSHLTVSCGCDLLQSRVCVARDPRIHKGGLGDRRRRDVRPPVHGYGNRKEGRGNDPQHVTPRIRPAPCQQSTASRAALACKQGLLTETAQAGRKQPTPRPDQRCPPLHTKVRAANLFRCIIWVQLT